MTNGLSTVLCQRVLVRPSMALLGPSVSANWPEGMRANACTTMTSKTPKTKNQTFQLASHLWTQDLDSTMKGGFAEWMSWVDSAFYDQGAIWILSRGFCQIQLHALTAQQQLPQGNTIHRITAAGFGHHKTEEFETSAPWKRVNSGAPMCLVTWRSCKNQEAVGISSLLQCINGRGQWGQTWHYGKMLVKNQAHHAIFRLDQIRTSVKWPLYHGQMLQSALIPRPCPTYWFWCQDSDQNQSHCTSQIWFWCKTPYLMRIFASKAKQPLPTNPTIACAQPTQSFQGDWRPSATVANPFDSIP